MKKICMIEYQGRCDSKGKAVGHAPKVLKEYMEFIADDCEVSVLAPKVILRELPEGNRKACRVLPHHIVMKGKTPFHEKVGNKLHMFANIHKALKNTDADTVWFFNVEYYLMLYLFLHRRPKQRVICTLFLDGYHASKQADLKTRFVASFKQWVFEQAQKKMDLIISTGQQFTFKNCNYEFIPDYYDRKDFYERYRKQFLEGKQKKEQAVCLGTMGNGKQIEEMVEAFLRIGYPLKVAGRFYDKQRVEQLKILVEKRKGNVEITDSYLSQEEYLALLAESKYTVLPYSPVNYASQTSGVMQEAMFLNTVPVTYEAILSGNGIPGIGFSAWKNLSAEQLAQDTTVFQKEYQRLRENAYSEDSVREKYQNIFVKDNKAV